MTSPFFHRCNVAPGKCTFCNEIVFLYTYRFFGWYCVKKYWSTKVTKLISRKIFHILYKVVYLLYKRFSRWLFAIGICVIVHSLDNRIIFVTKHKTNKHVNFLAINEWYDFYDSSRAYNTHDLKTPIAFDRLSSTFFSHPFLLSPPSEYLKILIILTNNRYSFSSYYKLY